MGEGTSTKKDFFRKGKVTCFFLLEPQEGFWKIVGKVGFGISGYTTLGANTLDGVT